MKEIRYNSNVTYNHTTANENSDKIVAYQTEENKTQWSIGSRKWGFSNTDTNKTGNLVRMPNSQKDIIPL